MLKTSRSIDELQKASNRVFYDYWMLDELGSALERELTPVDQQTPADQSRFLNSTGITITTYLKRDSNAIINNACIEAFGIHARALLDFFYGLEFLEADAAFHHRKFKRRDDDVFAEDFFGEPDDWRSARLPLPSDLEPIRIQVNKQIAHITYEGAQVEPKAKRWLFGHIREIIRPAYDVFRANAIREGLGERWGWK